MRPFWNKTLSRQSMAADGLLSDRGPVTVPDNNLRPSEQKVDSVSAILKVSAILNTSSQHVLKITGSIKWRCVENRKFRIVLKFDPNCLSDDSNMADIRSKYSNSIPNFK